MIEMLSMLRALVLKELLSLSRDLHGLAALFLMPALFIVIMSMALKDVYSPPLRTQAYAVVMHDDSSAARAIVQEWTARRGAPQALPENWQEALKRAQLKYVLVVETGFGAALPELKSPAAPMLRLIAEPGIEIGLYRSSVAELMALAGEQRARAITGRLLGAVPDDFKAVDGLVEGRRFAALSHPSSVQHNVPGWLVFGMFFVVAAMAGLFVQERENGTLARFTSLGVSQSMLIASKAVPYLLVNALQAGLMLAVGVWLMPRLGGEGLSLAGVHAGALLLMLAAISVAAVSMALALACLVRSQGQAAAIGPLSNVVMAAIGGIMVPTFVMPPLMQSLAALSPMNWALEGLLDVLLRAATPALLWPRILPLLVFAAVMFALAVLLFPRRIRP